MQITDRDIKELDRLQLTRLAHWLAINEARSFQIPTSSISCTFDIDTGDGGEDLSIVWTGGPDKTDLMWRDSLFQIKATPMSAAKCKAELLAEDGTLKQKIKDLFARGGTYILFCNRTSKDQVKAMTEVVEAQGFSKPSIKSYNPAAIQAWVNKYFPVVAFVAEQRGKPLPISLQTWTTWSRYPAHRDQFVADEVLDSYASVLRDKAQSKGNVVRICGPSGLGKSRLTIEAFSEPSLQRSVVFIDASSSNQIQDYLVSWLQTSFEGTLIVDNCTSKAHDNLANIAQHPDSKISLITVDFDVDEIPKSQTLIELKPMGQGVIEGMIRRKYPDLPDIDVGRIAEFAEGFPQMAVLMCEADLREHGSLSTLTPPILVNKLLFPHGNMDSQAFEVISVCALFDKFAFDDGQAGETALIAKRLCSDMPVEKFTQLAMKFKARNILEPHMGSYTKVTPKPLAWHLASKWWENCSKTLADLLVDNTWPQPLAEAMCRQLTFLRETPAAHTVAEKLCAPNCPFASAESLNSSRGSRLFCDLVEVNPEVTLECLERVFLEFSKDQLLDVRKGRRYLVWAIEKLSWEPEYFERAAFVLSKFADAENEERISNNATGQLKKLFHILLPGTKASLEQRLSLIDEMSTEYGATALVVSCLCAALSYGHFSRSGGMVEVQAGRLPERDYIPTWQEVSTYWLEILKRLLPMVGMEEHRNEVLRNLGSLFLYLLRFKFFEHLTFIIDEKQKSDPSFWVGGLESLQFAIKHEGKNLSDEENVTVQKLVLKLQPNSFEDQYRLLVAIPSWSNLEKDENGQVTNLNTARAEAFGEEAGRLWPEWSGSLALIFTGEQREPTSFACGLAKTIKRPEDFISQSLEYIKAQSERCNPSVLAEFITTLKTTIPSIVEDFLRKVEEDSSLYQYAAWFICRAGVDLPALDRLTRMLIEKKIGFADLRVLKFGGVLQTLPSKELERFLQRVIDLAPNEVEPRALALELVHMYVFQNKKHQTQMAKFTGSLLMTKGFLITLSEMQLHDWSTAVDRVLDEKCSTAFLKAISLEIVSVCELDHTRIYEFDRNLQPLISKLLKNHFDIVWPILGAALESENKNAPFNMALLLTSIGESLMGHDPQPIQSASEEKLAAWLGNHEAAMYRLLRHLRLWILNDPNSVRLTPLGQILFETYGGSKEFLDTMEVNLASVGGSGSLRPEYEAREVLMSQLANHRKLTVKRWAARVRRYYQKKIKNALKREEEQKHGIFEGWMREDI